MHGISCIFYAIDISQNSTSRSIRRIFLPGGHGHEVELALIVPIIHTAQNQLAILVVSQVEASENTTNSSLVKTWMIYGI